MKKQNEKRDAAKSRKGKGKFVAKPGEGIKVVTADGAAASKTYFHKLPGGAAVIVHHTAGKTDEAARRRVMRKIEARRNRSNREVALDAMEYMLRSNKFGFASLNASQIYAENAVETLKKRGLADDAADMETARMVLRIATEINSAIHDRLRTIRKSAGNSRLA